MKKFFLTLAVAAMTLFATAQTNQYFWYQGNLMMGNPIAQIDSVTFGEGEPSDTLHILLPRTIIKEVHDTVEIVKHDTVYINKCLADNGALPGEFSISATKKVRFSKGNLQFNPMAGTHLCADGTYKQGIWRFAEHQYDYVGFCDGNRVGNTYNENSELSCNTWSKTYDGWIDLFGWGVTGYNGVEVWESLEVWGNKYSGEGNLDNTYYDWGKYNAISNGGNQPGLWRTLSKEEWNYLLYDRPNASSLIIKTKINGYEGTIVLPDDWNASSISISNNNVSLSDWLQLEQNGAVFFPVNKRSEGRLWTTTASSSSNAWIIQSHWFENITINSDYKTTSQGVRLVQDVE